MQNRKSSISGCLLWGSVLPLLLCVLVVIRINVVGQQPQGPGKPAARKTTTVVPSVAPPSPSTTTEPSSTQTAATNSSINAANRKNPSGQPMPVGDIPGWHQIFTDNFNTNVPLGSFPSAVSNKWDAYPDGEKDTSKNGTYYPSKVVSIHDGVMDLYLHTEDGIHMVAAPEPKLPGAVGSGGGLLYGRYVIRFKADPVHGYKISWLLWPDSGVWPHDGEINFPEGNLDGAICGYLHLQNGTSSLDKDSYCTSTTLTSWHTAIIEWLPNKTSFILDGQTIGTSTHRVPDTPMHWVIQTETETSPHAPSPSNRAAGDVQIDWVAVYVPSNTALTPINTPSPGSSSLTNTSPVGQLEQIDEKRLRDLLHAFFSS